MYAACMVSYSIIIPPNCMSAHLVLQYEFLQSLGSALLICAPARLHYALTEALTLYFQPWGYSTGYYAEK